MSTTNSNTFKITVTPLTVGPWTPPYNPPTNPGQVVRIGGYGGPYSFAGGGGSSYPTNTWADVYPTEIGGPTKGNEQLWAGDAGCCYSPSFGQGGAMVIAGGGGHHGVNIFGAALFDFTDARWKHVWTSPSNGATPGDNVSIGLVDLRNGLTGDITKRVHNLANREDDIHDSMPSKSFGIGASTGGHYEDGSTVDRYKFKAITGHTVGAGHVFILEAAHSSGSFPVYTVGGKIIVSGVTGTAAAVLNTTNGHTITAITATSTITTSTNTTGLTASGGSARAKDMVDKFDGQCWNWEHWTSDAVLLNNGNPPDHREVRTEMTKLEPYPWVAQPNIYGSQITNGTDIYGSSQAVSGPHGWKFPGEWPTGLQTDVTGRTAVSTLTRTGLMGKSTYFDPTPNMPMPCPGHVWDQYIDIPPEFGGGSNGSVAIIRLSYQGAGSSNSVAFTWRFDYKTGRWAEWSLNSNGNQGTLAEHNALGGTPWGLPGTTAACYDSVRKRHFMHGLRGTESRMNYLNMGEKIWYNMSRGSSTAANQTGNFKSMECDPDRRLIIFSVDAAPYVRAMNIANLTNDSTYTTPGTGRPTTAVSGVKALNVTAAPGFSIDPAINPAIAAGNYRWMYCPMNGKLYRGYGRLIPYPSSLSAYNSGGNHHFIKLQRLTPPSIIANPPLDYYLNQPWTYDEIDVGTDAMNGGPGTAVQLPRPPYAAQNTAIGAKWFWWISSINCFAWFPLDSGSGNEGTPTVSSVSKHCMYLIKPY